SQGHAVEESQQARRQRVSAVRRAVVDERLGDGDEGSEEQRTPPREHTREDAVELAVEPGDDEVGRGRRPTVAAPEARGGTQPAGAETDQRGRSEGRGVLGASLLPEGLPG